MRFRERERIPFFLLVFVGFEIWKTGRMEREREREKVKVKETQS